MKFFLLVTLFLMSLVRSYSQTIPLFGNEIPVKINGLTFDAMEPFISPDGTTLYFNSLNDGVNTSLYYATKVDDSTFTYAGQVTNVNMPSPHLDAVASLDSANNFVWVSTRNYPSVFENLQRGKYNAGAVNNQTKVYGDFYIRTPGWLIMDQAINYNGTYLYYCNAYFNGCAGGLPCQAKLGIAQKINDSTFNKIATSDAELANINNVNYLVYAPQITKDGLELYFTRILKTGFTTEICVSVRSNTSAVFSAPSVIYSSQPLTPEAASPTTNKSIIYYHKKPSSVYKIFMRYRIVSTGITEMPGENTISIFPNPASDKFLISFQNKELKQFELKIFNVNGQEIVKRKIENNPNQTVIDLSSLPTGVYIVIATSGAKTIYDQKIIIAK